MLICDFFCLQRRFVVVAQCNYFILFFIVLFIVVGIFIFMYNWYVIYSSSSSSSLSSSSSWWSCSFSWSSSSLSSSSLFSSSLWFVRDKLMACQTKFLSNKFLLVFRNIMYSNNFWDVLFRLSVSTFFTIDHNQQQNQECGRIYDILEQCTSQPFYFPHSLQNLLRHQLHYVDQTLSDDYKPFFFICQD